MDNSKKNNRAMNYLDVTSLFYIIIHIHRRRTQLKYLVNLVTKKNQSSINTPTLLALKEED